MTENTRLLSQIECNAFRHEGYLILDGILSADEIDAFLESHRDWSRSGNEITRLFIFKDFGESMGFVTRVAMAADDDSHRLAHGIRRLGARI